MRLSLLFALVSLVLLGGLGAYLYHALGQQIAWRDDQMLQGRLERMEALALNERATEMGALVMDRLRDPDTAVAVMEKGAQIGTVTAHSIVDRLTTNT